MQWDSAVLVAVITALIQVAKVVGLPSRWSPILALVCGILVGVFYTHSPDLTSGILQGVIMGLASIGFYSGPKNIARTMKASSGNCNK